ncbi:MAG: peroxiredoxin [Planctomycetota bacterium]|jgi:peroxiredoxin Q/BCP
MAEALKVGTKAPAVSLPDEDGRKVSLKDMAGHWVVLYFYPKDDTPGCTTEACEFTSSIKDFEELDAVVMGVSPDPPASHRKFIDRYRLKLHLLSDAPHKVLQKYHAWGAKKMYGKSFEGVTRSTVLIDPDGKVAHHWTKVSPKGHAGEVRQKLAELRAG